MIRTSAGSLAKARLLPGSARGSPARIVNLCCRARAACDVTVRVGWSLSVGHGGLVSVASVPWRGHDDRQTAECVSLRPLAGATTTVALHPWPPFRGRPIGA